MRLQILALLCCFLLCVGSLLSAVSTVANTENDNTPEWDAATASTAGEMSIILMIPSVFGAVKNAAKKGVQ